MVGRTGPIALARPPPHAEIAAPSMMDSLVSRRRTRNLLLTTAAAATAGYGLYLHNRRRVAAVLSLSDAVSQVGSDLADFLRSDSDQIPRSLLQLSKLAASQPISSAASSLSESLAKGIFRAISSSHTDSRDPNPQTPPLTDRILDRLLSPAGTGFAYALVGSFARSLVLSYHASHPAPREGGPDWLTALCSDRGKDAAAELVRVLVSTAVAAYLDRSTAVPVRTSDQLLAGLTNPKHEAKVKDLLVSVCNGGIETFVRTTRQVAREEASVGRIEASVVVSSDRQGSGPPSPSCYVMERVSSTLAVPSNRRFVLDVTGRVTAETVRSFLDFLAQRVSDGAWKTMSTARNEVAERGIVAIKYMGAKSMAIFTICLALCMHISMGTRFLLPA